MHFSSKVKIFISHSHDDREALAEIKKNLLDKFYLESFSLMRTFSMVKIGKRLYSKA